jgi:acyl-coenzyme A thioesterase PaaI-like protein
MDVTQLPFNRLVGLEAATGDSGYLVCLPDGPQYANHLGTVHAGALLALAEAGSGTFLVQHFGFREDFVPVVRRLEAKFRKPARGRIFARCLVEAQEVRQWSEELAIRGRIVAPIAVELVDADGVIVLSALVEWFIAKRSDFATGN